ncbi:DUF2971 domain-containing protein [Vibrio sp. ED002]|uniref:DUF2971 domain-containing protein n=1 Tax=Vibrio sp. ED002 TaxID=2785123 RepID=UPI0032C49879|nr:DUF2971 domain-containing protein [Vibrio sp. ED002]
MLFKFLPEERVDVIRDLRIRFSPLSSLNDPFEQMPHVDMSTAQLKAVEDIKTRMSELWLRTDADEKTQENKNFFDMGTDELIEEVMWMLSSDNVAKEINRLFSDTFGILSLTRSNRNLLMWSHYASSMTGYVIEFDESNDFFHRPNILGQSTNLQSIKYSEIRQIPNIVKCGGLDLLCHKPIDWAYEQEERMFISNMHSDFKVGNLDTFGNDIYLYPIPRDAIKAIYFGCRMKETLKREISGFVKSNNIQCKLYNSSITSSEYKIAFEPYDTNA